MPAPPLLLTVLYCIVQFSPESWLTVPSFMGATLDRQVLDGDVAGVLGERIVVLALSVEDRARPTHVGRVVARDDLVVLTSAEGVNTRANQ